MIADKETDRTNVQTVYEYPPNWDLFLFVPFQLLGLGAIVALLIFTERGPGELAFAAFFAASMSLGYVQWRISARRIEITPDELVVVRRDRRYAFRRSEVTSVRLIRSISSPAGGYYFSRLRAKSSDGTERTLYLIIWKTPNLFAERDAVERIIQLMKECSRPA